MADVRPKLMTADEFLLWSLEQDERYELVDGVVVPLRGMAGASRSHDRIVVNLIASLMPSLRDGPCIPTTADTALRTAIRRVRRPDVTIECTPADPKIYEALKAVAVFEVLSPSTRATDHVVKLAEYMRHPTLRTIVYIDPNVRSVVVYHRAADQTWTDAAFEDESDRVVVDGTSAVLTLADIYVGVPMATPSSPAN